MNIEGHFDVIYNVISIAFLLGGFAVAIGAGIRSPAAIASEGSAP